MGYILLDISFEVIRRHPAMRAARKSQDVSAEQIQSMLTEDAKDYDAFVPHNFVSVFSSHAVFPVA